MLLPTLLALGSGPSNGDAAAYAAQAEAGVLADRWTHLGYLGPAALLARPFDAARALDLVSWLAAVVLVGTVAAVAHRDERDPRPPAILAAAVVLPHAPFAEVDLPWLAALWLGVVASPAWTAVAVAISPSALLAVPWMLVQRPERARAIAAGAVCAVLALTIVSGGAWWTGERGVLHTGPLLFGRTAAAHVRAVPWLMLLLVDRSAWRPLAACLPLLLLPPDVPGWLLPGLVLASRARPVRPAVVAAVLVLSAYETVGRVGQVREETAQVRRIAAALGPSDGVVAPWTWGARIAVEVSGDPYGIRWHPPGRFLRDQRRSWCLDPPTRARVVPSDDLWLDAAAIRAPCGTP